MAPSAADSIATVLAKLEELAGKLDESNIKADDTNHRLQQLAEEQTAVTAWKPTMEAKVTDLHNSVYDLRQKVDLFIHELPKKKDISQEEIPYEAPAPAHLGAAADAGASGPDGHRDDNNHRSVGAGVVTTLVPPPVTGAKRFSSATPVPFMGFNSACHSMNSQLSSYGCAVPQIEFPNFDGSNPKIWIKQCENYFDVYAVLPDYWVKLATMHFTQSAAVWLQSVEMDLRKCSWQTLTKAVVDRFERDQYNHIIRQFFHIKQSGSVAEYIESFEELVHKLLAHDPGFNPSAITSRFVDGLKNEIKAVVLVHRPKDLDTASSLAILQEEVLLGYSSKEVKRQEVSNPVKFADKNIVDAARRSPASFVPEDRNSPSSAKGKSNNDKLAALMAYRKAKGLCYKCGLKWGPQHHCPENVSLHVVEELWQMVSTQDPSSTLSADTELQESDSGDDLMEISESSTNGTYRGKTIKFQGHIQQHKAIFLVDSGSSHTL